ncbi:MAG: thioredoxin domain-containing protein, partial [Bacteroidota bacterium]
SAQAAEKFVSLGFEKVYDLKGGIMAWDNSGRKIATSGEAVKMKIERKSNHIYSKTEFDSIISTGNPLLINFYAKWCAPCKKMDPVLDKLTKLSGNEKIIYRVDVDAAKDLCKDLKIEGPPVVKLFKEGKEIKSLNGFQDENQLNEHLKNLK